jgi:two-component system, NtrC family, sensor kinase
MSLAAMESAFNLYCDASHRGSLSMSSFQSHARRLVFLGMILVPVIPILVILLLGDWTMGGVLRQAAQFQMERVAEDHAAIIDAFLKERLNDLRSVLAFKGPQELLRDGEIKKALEELRRLDPSFQDLGLISKDGAQIAYAGPFDLLGKNYTESTWLKHVASQGSFISDVYQGFRKLPHFTAAVCDAGGTTLRATIDSEAFGKLVESVRLGQRGRAYVIDAAGVLQTRDRNGPGLLERDPDAGQYPVDETKTASAAIETGQGQGLITVTPLNRGRWRLVVRQPLKDALGGLSTIRLYAAGVLLLGGLLVIPSAWLLSRKIGTMLGAAERDKRELENQLARAGRLAELGTMTAGFAHEINNPLQVMSSEISLLEIILSESVLAAGSVAEDAKKDICAGIEQLRIQIGRCAKITHAILKFGRRGQTREEHVRVEPYLAEVADMVRRKTEVNGIDFEVATDPDVRDIYADPGKLQQVLLNLLNNAIYAIIEQRGSEGGRLSLRATPGGPNEISVAVRDNGAGMTPETLDKIFVPFFTTKPGDQGTGLGLPLCYGLVESMGGSIRVKSVPGQGTEFVVRLPAVK